MLVYWTMVMIPALLSLTERGNRRYPLRPAVMGLLFLVLLVFMGLRETAGDFYTYQLFFEMLDGEDLVVATTVVEPIYGFLNWLSSQLGLGIYGVNTICALIFLYCLWRAAMKESTPIFFVTLAIPYFLIVVGMGYTRQGVAAGLVLLAIVQARERRMLVACISVALAMGFHYSALVGFGFLIFGTTNKYIGWVRWLLRMALASTLVVASQMMLGDQLDNYTAAYIESGHYESTGAFLRASVTGVAAGIFFLFGRSLRAKYDDYGLWQPFALVAIACVPLSLIASTPVDRLGLYLLPFQVLTFSRLPTVVNFGRYNAGVKLAVLVAYIFYFFVWLHMGAFASELWVPYRWVFS